MHQPFNYCNRAFCALALLGGIAGASSSARAQKANFIDSTTAETSLRQLSADGMPGSEVDTGYTRPRLSPDGQWVVYVHDPALVDANELYSVGRYGGTPVRLSAQLPVGSRVIWFAISGDSSRVVYLAAQETLTKYELWSVPIGGPSGATVKISPPLPAFGAVFSGTLPIMSPDGTHVVFYADSTTDSVGEVWSAPLDASSAAVRLSPAPVSGGGVTFIQADPMIVTADSARVVFTGDFLADEQNMLFSAPLDGSAAAKRLSLITDHPSADVSSFKLTPDGQQALYVLDRAIDERFELFRAPVNGTAGAQLSPISTTAPTSAGDVAVYAIAPDSSRAVFTADIQVDARVDLWSVPLSGNSSNAAIISPALVANQETKGPAFSPDSSRVVFFADEGANNVYNLWSAPANGASPAVRLNPAIAATADVERAAFTSDGARVVYAVLDTAQDPDVRRLWTVPAGGPLTSADELTATALAAGTINTWTVSPDDLVVMIGALDSASDIELYRMPADASADRLQLASSTASSTIETYKVQLYAGGARALFRTNTTTGRRMVDVPLDGSAPAAPIDLLPPNATSGFSLAWPTDVGDGVLFTGDYEIAGRFDLWLLDRAPTRIFADDFDA